MWNPPQSEKLLTSPAISRILGTAKPTTEKMMEAGIFGTIYQGERSNMVQNSEVEAFMSRDKISLEDLPMAFIVKPAPARPVAESDRDWIGYHSSMPESIAAMALDRWWSISNPSAMEGKLFVAVLGAAPVRVRRITAVAAVDPSGRVALETVQTSSDDIEAKHWQAARIDAIPGGLTVRHKF